MFSLRKKKLDLPSAAEALPGRAQSLPVPQQHFVNGHRLQPPFPQGMQIADFGLGCFWGAERIFWNQPGVYSTAVGYAGGITPNPTYEEVCTGMTGHTEVVRVIFDPQQVSFEQLLQVFWESHDPTQGMRQGNDVGTQYRSCIYWHDESQRTLAERSAAAYGAKLQAAGYGQVTTEIRAAPTFYYAEDYHQQYLAKNPGGYCGIGGTGRDVPDRPGSRIDQLSARTRCDGAPRTFRICRRDGRSVGRRRARIRIFHGIGLRFTGRWTAAAQASSLAARPGLQERAGAGVMEAAFFGVVAAVRALVKAAADAGALGTLSFENLRRQHPRNAVSGFIGSRVDHDHRAIERNTREDALVARVGQHLRRERGIRGRRRGPAERAGGDTRVRTERDLTARDAFDAFARHED
jgi:peptide-methionine (S)-S-oxide reductase